jgi:hypothetical protein
MPLPRYTLLHREAVLTSQERLHIYEWSRAERKRLRAAPARVSSSAIDPLRRFVTIQPLRIRHCLAALTNIFGLWVDHDVFGIPMNALDGVFGFAPARSHDTPLHRTVGIPRDRRCPGHPDRDGAVEGVNARKKKLAPYLTTRQTNTRKAA